MDRLCAWMMAAWVTLIAVVWSGCGQTTQTTQPASTVALEEPLRLDLTGIRVQELPVESAWDVIRTGYPSTASPSTSEPSGPVVPPVIEIPVASPVAAEASKPVLADQPKHSVPNNGPFLVDPSATVAPEPRAPVAEMSITKPSSAPAVEHGHLPSVAAISPGQSIVQGAATRASMMILQGFSLAERGALYSARSEFMTALRVITSAQDEADGSRTHTKALRAALNAIEESRDFELGRAVLDEIDVAGTVAGHRTMVLAGESLADLSPAAARERYHVFACEQLSIACGRESTGAKALFGLGRLAVVAGKAQPDHGAAGLAEGLVWYHAAMLADPQNFRAAHEAGVAYAELGQWERARFILQRAISISSHPSAWKNLAIIHAQLGERDLAAAAHAQAHAGGIDQIASTLPPIQWVDQNRFRQSPAPNDTFLPSQNAMPSVTAKSVPELNPRSAAKPASSGWSTWGAPRR